MSANRAETVSRVHNVQLGLKFYQVCMLYKHCLKTLVLLFCNLVFTLPHRFMPFLLLASLAMNLFRNNATTKKEKEKEIQYEDPPDGGWGWMVVLHCFLVRRPLLNKHEHLKRISCKILHFPTNVTICGYDIKSFVFLSAGKRPCDGNAEELRDLLCGFSRWVWRLGGEHQLDRLHHVQPASVWRFVLRKGHSVISCIDINYIDE